MKRTHTILFALAACAGALIQTGCTPPESSAQEPAPAALEAAPTVDIAASLDRIARSNEAQTAALRELLRTVDSLQVRVALLEDPPEEAPPEPAVEVAVTTPTAAVSVRYVRRGVFGRRVVAVRDGGNVRAGGPLRKIRRGAWRFVSRPFRCR